MTTTQCDYLIIGTGCAGLSLAVHLVEAGIEDKHIILVDPRTTFPRDRTWCFWNVSPHPFDKAVSHVWNQWRVASPSHESVSESPGYAYHHIAADDFYAAALSRLRHHPHIELRLGQRVLDLSESTHSARVETTAGVIEAGAVFDSRPPQILPARNGIDDVCLLQHFVGAFVQTAQPVFTPDTVTLMDFRVDQQHGIHFCYVLPFGPADALVEATYISPRPLESRVYEQSIQTYMRQTYGQSDYTIRHWERGAIPMCSAPLPQRRSPRVYAIGLAGGLAKPSSGYAFLAIQKFSAAFAARLRQSPLPAPPRPRSSRAVFLDRVFLSYLRHHPETVPNLFGNLFARVRPDTLVRFLSDESALTEDLQVMWAMPKLAFAVETLKAKDLWWCNR